MEKVSRRQFLHRSGAALAGLAAMPLLDGRVMAAEASPSDDKNFFKVARGSGFTMWQLNTQCNDIGNTYVFLTDKGRVVVMDGGWKADEYYLRGFLAMLGNKVDTWFISHPHDDHITSLNNILKEPRGITIRRIVHSSFNEALMDSERKEYGVLTRELYKRMDDDPAIEVVDLHEPGYEGRIDGFNFRILGVSNPEIMRNPYNNSSMVIRVWDKRKSIVFLGDAGVECGDKLLAGPYRKDLDCDYMQMAHHGQNGCSEAFYKAVNFRACLWSTPKWVWNNDIGKGFNTHRLKTIQVREWMDRKGIKEHHVSWQGLWRLP